MRRNRKIGSATPSLVCTTQAKVRFSEVDSMRVVWHGEYVRYFEDGREAFGRMYPGVGYTAFYDNGYMAPIVDMQLQYITPLALDDVAVIETRYIDSDVAKLCFEYIIHRQSDGALIARGSTVQVFIDKDGVMQLNNPTFIEEWKKRWLTKE